MNFSIYNADRATHLRIVVAALVAGIAIVAFASLAQIRNDHLPSAKLQASIELRSDALTRTAIR